MSAPRMRLAILSAVILTVVGGVDLFRKPGKERLQTLPAKQGENRLAGAVLPEPPPLESRYLNTTSDAGYVGNQACTACHADEHESYLSSAHAAATERVLIVVSGRDGKQAQKQFRIGTSNAGISRSVGLRRAA